MEKLAQHPAKITLKCLNVKTTLDVIGGKWKPLILFLLKDGRIMRFSELLKSIEGITQKMLAEQLRELEKDGLVNRKAYPVIPPKVEYSMTEFGQTLIPIFILMDQWARKYSPQK